MQASDVEDLLTALLYADIPAGEEALHTLQYEVNQPTWEIGAEAEEVYRLFTLHGHVERGLARSRAELKRDLKLKLNRKGTWAHASLLGDKSRFPVSIPILQTIIDSWNLKMKEEQNVER